MAGDTHAHDRNPSVSLCGAARGALVPSMSQPAAVQQFHRNEVRGLCRSGCGCNIRGPGRPPPLSLAPTPWPCAVLHPRRCGLLGLSSPSGNQSLTYEAGWRRIADTSLCGSKAVRMQVPMNGGRVGRGTRCSSSICWGGGSVDARFNQHARVCAARSLTPCPVLQANDVLVSALRFQYGVDHRDSAANPTQASIARQVLQAHSLKTAGVSAAHTAVTHLLGGRRRDGLSAAPQSWLVWGYTRACGTCASSSTATGRGPCPGALPCACPCRQVCHECVPPRVPSVSESCGGMALHPQAKSVMQAPSSHPHLRRRPAAMAGRPADVCGRQVLPWRRRYLAVRALQ